jgi:hypothetical protein
VSEGLHGGGLGGGLWVGSVMVEGIGASGLGDVRIFREDYRGGGVIGGRARGYWVGRE